ncbi:hypothetical protein CH272_18865 [Rhodococcus sp. 05-340-1]|uniref:FAD-dependent oxidoreductase n=1 Tax=Nocardiaceae TaxID=85025 RepID=UPI00069177E8|nr:MULTISPECIES: FAD-dependent monooxygenase [Rhodococcus]OZC87676.1 hypothetical protein CH254_13935 [Rhodococcus sp. 06-412-2C]OZC96327.1 hypothetical protein CH279_14105 [Rhodococcus sp. 06-412-2B]OZD65310.1 hypothetical protein CH271_19925 [Rhodococcus sp. 05-340-2]OZD74643.1 hypothetical protein CH272_18865 [Rhodococcus sp. 05-340-1]OZD86583.1 hypothetical protein CH273_00160 [Rhodococcus sp. 05-339-2]
MQNLREYADSFRNSDKTGEPQGFFALRAIGDNLNVMARRNGDGSIRVSVSIRGDENWFVQNRIDAADPVGSKARLRQLFSAWDPSLIAMLDATDDRVVPRPILATPLDVRWKTQPDVTLLGDAAHLMAPTGDGANQAMLDGAILGTSIAETLEARKPLSEAVCAYEAEMFPRASAIAAESRRMEELGIASDAARNLVAMLASVDSP